MGVVMGFTAVILGIAAALVGLMVWTALLFPRPAERARLALERRPWRCFLLGLVLVGILGVPALAMMNAAHGLIKLAGWVVAFPLVSVLVVGLTAMANLLGERLRLLSPSVTPLGGLVRGAITLELSLVLPIFGWFLFAPLVAITLAGAGAIGCLARSRTKDEPSTHPQRQRAGTRHRDHGEDLAGNDPISLDLTQPASDPPIPIGAASVLSPVKPG